MIEKFVSMESLRRFDPMLDEELEGVEECLLSMKN